jgi:2-methylcitrate dehydratase PrpD
MNSPTRTLSEYIAKAKFEDIPRDILEDAKYYILDSMGCVIGGCTLKPGKIIMDLFTELGGAPEASILGTGKKLPCMHTAYVNAYIANLLDLDDTYSAPPAHPGATIVPPGFALAEKIRASGKDFITAVVTAYEGWARICQAIAPSVERMSKVAGFSTHQIFGTAIVASKLLGFNVEQTANTLGLAGANAPVPNIRRLGLEEGQPITWIKNNYGWASMGGVLAASLTEKGFVGNKYILDGDRGFWIMAGSDQCDFDEITLNLSADYVISKTAFKPYASCRGTHSSLDATVEIMAKHNLDVDKIKAIRAETHQDLVRILSGRNPTNIIDAQFSLPHLIALELLGKSPRKGLSDEDFIDPAVRSLAEKVYLEVSPEIEEEVHQGRLYWAAIVSIEQTDGKLFSERVDIPKWDPGKWPTREELRSKFTYLTAPIIGIDTSEAVMGDIEQLENLKDISTVISRISQGIQQVKQGK